MEGGEHTIISKVMQTVDPDVRVLKRFDIDIRHAALKDADPWMRIGENLYRDEWGTVYRDCGPYCEMIGFPLAEIETAAQLDNYRFPDPLDERRFAGLEEQILKRSEDGKYPVMLGGFSESFLGLPSWLMGHQKCYTDLMLNEPLITALLDRLEDYFTRLARETLRRAGHLVQIVKVADDLGTQQGPILSPELYRRLIKPRQSSLYKLIKENTDAKLFLHSCGSVYELIADFIDMGVDILNPVQVSAKNMEPKRLKEEFGDRLVFWGGGCDTQNVLPNGTVEEVRQEVQARIDAFAPGGGFVFCAVHNIQYDVPPENIVAMYDAARHTV